ncbi:MAG TPA: hypothetical protein VL017_05410 [Devosia sp.]|nr:hypothetical protein [Devosia sp.]
MALDTRWKNPQGKTPEQLYDAIVQIVRELRKGDYLPDTSAAADVTYDNATSGLTADNVQDALDEVEGRVDTLEAVTPGLVLLNSGTVTNQATLDIPLTSFTAYRGLKFLLRGVRPLTDNVNLQMRLSTDGGANFISAGYNYSGSVHYDNATTEQNGASGQAQIILGAAAADAQQSNVAGHGANFEVELWNQASGSFFPRIIYRGSYFSDTDFGVYAAGQGMIETAQDVDAARFFMSSGNITADWALYGYA